MTTAAAYRKHESAKKKEYAQRVREVEHGVFTPLVLSATGGMGREAATFTRDWQMESPGRSTKNILSSWDGFVVVSPSQSSALLSYAFVEADPLATAQSMNYKHCTSYIRGMCSLCCGVNSKFY